MYSYRSCRMDYYDENVFKTDVVAVPRLMIGAILQIAASGRQLCRLNDHTLLCEREMSLPNCGSLLHGKRRLPGAI